MLSKFLSPSNFRNPIDQLRNPTLTTASHSSLTRKYVLNIKPDQVGKKSFPSMLICRKPHPRPSLSGISNYPSMHGMTGSTSGATAISMDHVWVRKPLPNETVGNAVYVATQFYHSSGAVSYMGTQVEEA